MAHAHVYIINAPSLKHTARGRRRRRRAVQALYAAGKSQHDRRAAQHAPVLPDVQPHRTLSTKAQRAGGAATLEVPPSQRAAYVVCLADHAQRDILRPSRSTPGRRGSGRSFGEPRRPSTQLRRIARWWANAGLHLRLRLHQPSQVASVLTYLTATLMMALTAFSDPGTVPPATAATRRAPPSPSEVLIHGETVTLKYCVACGIQAPRRVTPC